MTRPRVVGERRALLAAAAAAASCAVAPPPADGPAVPLHRPPPVYPQAAVDARVEGCVVVSFVILPDGRADRYQVLDSQPPGVFDHASLKALNQWRFRVPAPAGRHAQRIDYALASGGMPPPRPCREVPSYEALNPPGSP